MTDTPAERAAESIWTMLRRRKVVQWGIAYAAGAWLLMQVLEYFSGTFDWPRQVQQLSTLALLIGLPVVLVLAYYHGDRGQQRITTPEFAILTLLLLLGGGAFWYYQRASEAEKDVPPAASAVQPAASPAVTAPRPSIAVLPFENRSRLEDDAFFVDGIHDDILTQLSKVSALRVISRTSVEQFRDTKLSMKAIADQLRVTRILEGGVQRAGDRVRINVQLIDAATDAHLWAERYDRELTAVNIFAIQSEVATAIASALQASLPAGEKARIDAIPTENLEAWQAYQLGKQRMAKRTSTSLADAEKYFRDAIALDSAFAPAWAGLADTLALQTIYSGRAREGALDEAEKAVAQALVLDPNLAEAWASAGSIAYERLQLDRSEQSLRRAIALNPSYAPAHHWLSMTLADLGRRDDEALAAAERAVMLDPLSAVAYTSLGNLKTRVGLFDQALTAQQRAIEIEPTWASAYVNVGDVHSFGSVRWDTAVGWYMKAATLDPGNPEPPTSLAFAYWHLGDDAEAQRWLTRALANGEEFALTNAVAVVLHLGGGDLALARTRAQRAAASAPWSMFLIRDDDLRRGDYATARARYAKAFPELFAEKLPELTQGATFAAIDLALVLQHTGEDIQAKALLDRSEAYIRTIPRLGVWGFGISDVAIHALRGDTALALAKLREAEQAGWTYLWRYYRDFDPNLASIRNKPEFKAVFADIERDMARQRAALAARPKDAPLNLKATGT